MNADEAFSALPYGCVYRGMCPCPDYKRVDEIPN